MMLITTVNPLPPKFCLTMTSQWRALCHNVLCNLTVMCNYVQLNGSWNVLTSPFTIVYNTGYYIYNI